MSISHKRRRVIKGGRNRSKRVPTFKTEESAKKWAEDNKITKYTIVNMKSPENKVKKIKVIPK